MKQFEIIDFPKFVEEIFNASENLYLSIPSIDEEMADALILVKQQKPTIKIKVVVDNSEDSIRNGFGDIEGIDKLTKNDIQIFQSDGNLISFIVSDTIGYFLFPHSRIFIEKAKGTNAFRIDPVSIKLLIHYFFPSEEKTDNKKFEQTAIIGDANKHFEEAFKELENNNRQSAVSEFDNKKHEENKKKLKINPPLEPDLQRQINTYTAKIQFVELKFSGGNLENKIAQLPEKAIPINSPELKSLLQTRMKMFQAIDKHKDFAKLQEFKNKVEKLRKDYLTPITCRPSKSIIKNDDKEKFLDELNKLKEETKTLNKTLATMLETGRLNTLDLLKSELKKFFRTNEPDELKNLNQQDIKDRKLEEIINKIVTSVKFPEVNKLIEKILLTELFYDLTWSDFKDEKLHKEFVDKKIMEQNDIESIVKMKEAFDTKK